ncbi:hypothetical protein CONLIGDRAFT_594704 [Coniochaeta ligniaria NRRL 30616]|uniref:Uncharacterized protein n=1 Tax=Coniochaeta ligniaria NRRL 30616 TaxID=1408157 RepID=A0A1J7ITF2_9PEZI|nr:hypothetical protein CONLIGDRAFT_594704 [Coniochaeta ligniaria NRRL 30616]
MNSNWQPPQTSKNFALFQEHCRKARLRPFLDERPMAGKPNCTWKDFCRPLLRRFDGADIDWSWEGCQLLSTGIRDGTDGADGVVWKVKIGDGVYALKVFWDNSAPDGRYWAFQRECLNIALLQMMQTAVQDCPETIYLKPDPESWKEAIANLHAFSDEGRRKPRFCHLPNAVQYAPPRIRGCFGWTKISGKELRSLGPGRRPPTVTTGRVKRQILPSEHYSAIVFEYIPEPEGPMSEIERKQLIPYWQAGFCFVSVRPENWKGDVLLDMSDIACPWDANWSRPLYNLIKQPPECSSGDDLENSVHDRGFDASVQCDF